VRTDYLPLLESLRTADRERSDIAAQVAALTPRAALEEVTGTSPGAPPPAGPAAASPRLPQGLAAVSVRLLGPVRVTAPGPVDPAARDLLTEVVVAAALHPEGLHEAVLRAEVWPRGVSDDVLADAVAQVQTWLGVAADGRPRLHLDDAGRYVLSADVHTDWDRLRAAAAAPEGPDQAAVLEGALATVAGAAFDAPGSGFGSLAFHRAARDARVIGTAVARRSAALALERGDIAGATQALRAGLRLVPAAEALWRELLRVTATSDPGAVAEVARQAYAALAGSGLRPEPETDALVQHLVPGFVREAG
jgi:hypothetical protein